LGERRSQALGLLLLFFSLKALGLLLFSLKVLQLQLLGPLSLWSG
jgi:hypothetical protein